MTAKIKFGTDGWRAIIAEDFTFDNVRICAQSAAEYLKRAGLADRGLVIGYDTRFASEDFASAAAEVAVANGIRVLLCRSAAPTPVISYAILKHNAGGGIVITASHNSGKWNGFKYKQNDARSASPEVIAELETDISRIQSGGEVKRIPIDIAISKGLVDKFDPSSDYIEHIAGMVDIEKLRNSGLKVVVDSMYGAGSGYFRRILAGGNTEIIEIHDERNPLFPGMQPEPIAHNLKELSEKVRECGGSAGLATDGDADRIGIMDEKGVFITTLQVYALLALYLLEVRGQRGPIIKTITTTNMLYRLGEIYDVPVYETPVGFKYVAPLMMKENALIGGEESGGFGYRGHMPERDGVLSGLFFLDLMVRLEKSPSQLIEYLYSKVGPHHYDRLDIEFPAAERDAIINRLTDSNLAEIEGVKLNEIDTRDGFRFVMQDRSWLLIRFSGTEPIMRVYSESDSPERVKRFLNAGRRMAGV
ncbi:MAG: phosphoglucomutase/phosphomannomutase family protein [Chloroflexota bacterium]|nr:phosphoglucomutase/phosphomannomutase family protein [Chloroflexota bacterium]